MDGEQITTEFLLGQCARYPALRPVDLLKALHQSVFGCGHFVTDEAAGVRRIREELAALPAGDGPDIEPLDGGFHRVHLRYAAANGLSPETLFRLFALSAETPCGGAAGLEEKLEVLLALARDGRLPFSYEELVPAVEDWRSRGFPACRHSEPFRAAYAPAYRLVRREFVRILPLLAAIDRKMAEQRRVLVAVEGGSASGKTTLAALLERIYGCNVFHMDDFFLRPEQRTAERLAEPGGNVDRERFAGEVLCPLTRGRTVEYRRYDCRAGTLGQAVEIAPKALNIVEGAYSMHPELAGRYDLSVFLRVSPELQRARILARNGPEAGQRFFTRWIPLEERYFAALDPAGRCDLILEVEA
ncbi:MAG: hypothetical protein Q4C45_11915 [Oscillospiraceae bacterium]|nr:hypothetical protein [Oscillospiraceae bacterium]